MAQDRGLVARAVFFLGLGVATYIRYSATRWSFIPPLRDRAFWSKWIEVVVERGPSPEGDERLAAEAGAQVPDDGAQKALRVVRVVGVTRAIPPLLPPHS